jgi:hypothetical protein
MDRVVPGREPAAVVAPHDPKGSPEGGRPPMPLERMLWIFFPQLRFNLSHPAVEEALYDFGVDARVRRYRSLERSSAG